MTLESKKKQRNHVEQEIMSWDLRPKTLLIERETTTLLNNRSCFRERTRYCPCWMAWLNKKIDTL